MQGFSTFHSIGNANVARLKQTNKKATEELSGS